MSRSISIAVCLSLAVAWESPAHAQNSGTADADLLLGEIRTFPTEAAARAACGKDTVVWAERYAGYYFRHDEAGYGTKPQGAFACMHNAREGNYWDTNPMSVMGPSHPGRNFPYQPLPAGS